MTQVSKFILSVIKDYHLEWIDVNPVRVHPVSDLSGTGCPRTI